MWHINSGGKKLGWLNTKKFSGKSSELIEQNDDDDADIKAPDIVQEKLPMCCEIMIEVMIQLIPYMKTSTKCVHKVRELNKGKHMC